MSAIDYSGPVGNARTYALPLDLVQQAALWLLISVSWIVVIEPAPYEFLFPLVLIAFLPGGMRATRTLAPMIVFLLLYNIGGALSVIPVMHKIKAVIFIAVSFYMAVMAIFFAFICVKDPVRIISIVRNAYIVAAVCASIFAVVSYFNVAGLAEDWAPIGRAQGMFKDPNVFAAYLILPAVFIVHGLITGTQRWAPLAVIALLIILAGSFFAFSRGAWAALFAAMVMMLGLTFMLSPSLAQRSRVVLFTMGGGLLSIALLTAALSIHEVREMFLQRAQLFQAYDSGETGRFARQLMSIPFLLESPNGFGPREFSKMFGEDPHNVYLNAFAAYGWLGGLSYLLLSVATVLAGWRAVFTRTPWQPYAIVVVSVLFAAMLQGLQVDTDHWRHFYVQLGLVWGLYAATEIYVRDQARS